VRSRRTRHCCALLLSVLAVAGTSRAGDDRYQRAELELDDGEVLRYGLYLPDLKPGETAPLVLALHYGGKVTPYYGLQFLQLLVGPAFEELGAVIVAPDCPGEGWTDPRSERAVLALLDHARDRRPIDPERTVVTGFSLGGIGAWHLARRHPARFRAAVPVAGIPTTAPGGDVPVYAIHGKLDEVIDVGPTREAIAELRERGVNAKLVIVRGLSHYQTARYAGALRRSIAWLRGVWSVEVDGEHDE
jgi:predicted peptidase